MNKNVFKKRYIYLIAFFYSLLIIIFIVYQYNEYTKKQSCTTKMNTQLSNINTFINKCKKGELIKGILRPLSKPKITALITVHNSEKYIQTAITSVQNQNFNDIEILIVDDCSYDKSVQIIQKFQKTDKRIKLIINKVNKGILYSKSLGVLKSRGKFIMFLDGDDLFVNQNIFSTCFKQAINNNIDVVEFSGFESNFSQILLNDSIPKIPVYLRYKKNEETIRQPALSSYLYKRLDENKFKLIDGFLWGKTIKTKVLKDTLKQIGAKIYTKRLNYGDDRLINFVLFKVAKSFKYIKEFGYLYNQNNASITHINLTNRNCKDELTNIFFMYNYTKNTLETEIAAYEIVHRWNKIIYPGLKSTQNKKYLENIVDLMVKDKFISITNKKRLVHLTNYMDR